MSFVWPGMLIWAAVLPALLILYVLLLRRRRKMALQYPSLAVVQEAAGESISWRRHLPPSLLLISLLVLVVAGARPTAGLTLPSFQQTIVLAMDVSRSMQAADIAPNRITASQAAAKAFVEELPPDVRIGVVAYGDHAIALQAPTAVREKALAAIDGFKLQQATAIGSGIVAALAAIFPDDPIAPATAAGAARSNEAVAGSAAAAADRQPDAVMPGSYRSAAIVLLTDGANTSGPPPLEAAQLAADRGVKVFTVGFGTPEGTVIDVDGARVRVKLDEGAMQKVAALTGGEYFHASNHEDLKKVYDDLNARLTLENAEVEITALFAWAAALLVLLSAALSLWWFGRVA